MSKKKPRKKVLSAKEKQALQLKRNHRNLVRAVFRNSGFSRFNKLADREFSLDASTKSDFDDVFVYENVVVCAEYTCSKGANVGSHIKSKKIIYDHIINDPSNFMDVLKALDGAFAACFHGIYTNSEIEIRFLYCSRFDFENKHKSVVSAPVFLDYPELRYFFSLAGCIKVSARSELLDFLGVSHVQLGVRGKIGKLSGNQPYEASLLPEASSNFSSGFKVVSFYIDPEALIRRAYVLRRQSWRDSEGLYQRLISKAKINSIRKHLKRNRRVFVNNVIATLDGDTKIVDENGSTVDPSTITSTQSVVVQVPDRYNSIGLIDGQHRTFSYFESNPDDSVISKLRIKQNLLVTGIIYPKNISDRQREIFEAQLFLEINSTQTNAKSDLKQTINRLVTPFSDESIAYSIVDKLGTGNGPLGGHVVTHWFDTDKLKTTSVVSYAMKPLVKTQGNDTLFKTWREKNKDNMVASKDITLLDAYVKYCAREIEKFLNAVKKSLPSKLWTPARAVPGRLITTTVINGLLICFRFIVEQGKITSMSEYEKKLSGISEKEFGGYHSSQYRKLAESLFQRYFA